MFKDSWDVDEFKHTLKKKPHDSDEDSRCLTPPPAPSYSLEDVKTKEKPLDDTPASAITIKEGIGIKQEETYSPFTKELITKLHIKQEILQNLKTPVKDESELENSSTSDTRRKSVKRTVFTRDSPYKKPELEMGESPAKRISVKDRLGLKLNDVEPPKK